MSSSEEGVKRRRIRILRIIIKYKQLDCPESKQMIFLLDEKNEKIYFRVKTNFNEKYRGRN